MQAMSVLQVVRRALIERYHWPSQSCRLTYDAQPGDCNLPWCVCLADAGSAGSPIDGHFLREEVKLEIGVWRNISHLPEDRTGDALLASDPYDPAAKQVVQIETDVKRQLHFNYALIEQINGACRCAETNFTHPFVYQGTSPYRVLPEGRSPKTRQWLGRVLKFNGAMLIAPIEQLRDEAS